MSTLDAAAAAAMLAADTDLPYALVPWTPPLLGHRPTRALRNAVDALLDTGGGLLGVHVRSGLARAAATGRASSRALLAALRGVQVAELHTVRCSDGVLLVARVIPSIATVPPDLRAVEGADLDDMVALAADQLEGAVPAAQLDGVDEDLAPDERILIASGAVSVERGVLLPTVAGLIALGSEPWRLLGGLVAQVTVSGASRAVTGSGVTLPGRVAEVLPVTDEARDVVVALVQRGLVERAWLPHAQDEPLEVRLAGRRVEMAWPRGHGENGVPNRTLRRLLRAVGALGGTAERPERIAAALACAGGRWVGERRSGEHVVVEVVLPGARRERVEAPRRQTAPRTKRELVRAIAPRAEREPVPIATPKVGTAPVLAPTPTPAPKIDRDAAVTALLVDRGRVTTREVIDALGWSRSTTRDVLARMVASGELVSAASAARSPHQAYTLP